MGRLFNWKTWLLNYVLRLFLYVESTLSNQQGFVSIQCCLDANLTDPSTNITWTGDAYWYPSNQTCQFITRAVENDTDYTKSSVFDSGGGPKWCYNLPTKRDQHYLIRGTFSFGDLQRASPPGSSCYFRVSVDATATDQLNLRAENKVEVLFKASRDRVNFCLLMERAEAYISKLELRPVASNYLIWEPSSVLKLIDRVDTGNNRGDIRYPFDEYDRIWRQNLYADSMARHISSSMPNISSDSFNTTSPPIEVLQTAITHPEKLEFLYDNLHNQDSRHNLYLYFVELNESVQAGERVFDIYVNGVKRIEVDIVLGGSRSLVVVLNVKTQRYLNLTLVKATEGSQLGPVINAYEILEVHPILIHDTVQDEVETMMAVKNELGEHNQDNEVLKSWSGDPCVPASWPGLFCHSANGTSVITRIDLSFCKLHGPLPPSITKLVHLTKLNMSNNGFIGPIPAFPASSTLASMDISHNNLNGDIADLLTSLPNLTTLYSGCNPLLSNSLPESINRSNMNTDTGTCTGHNSARGRVTGAVTALFLLVALAVGVSLICNYPRKSKSRKFLDKKKSPVIKSAIYSTRTQTMPNTKPIETFTLQFIEEATQKYKTLIGEGGFGPVYRGTLPDGQEVAVKVRSSTSTQGTREFDNEMKLLSDIHHENLVPLLGYCLENDQKILVYPFMSNGSLQDQLYGETAKRRTLDWPTRLSIALGAARGLTYLHTFPGGSVIHRDVKSSNILLDQSMCANVADFGFSKYAPQEGDSSTSLEVRGTAGYLDPEYYSSQQLSEKSDVFSYGVVLLEIVTGREPLNINRPRNEWSLVEWAKPLIRSSRIDDIVDPSIKGGYHAEAMWRVVEVALACIEPYSANRPSMIDIVRELEDALIIENNASEYMKSIDSFGGSSRYSVERPIIILPIPTQTELSPIPSEPSPPQPR